jgi:hypothetical protein
MRRRLKEVESVLLRLPTAKAGGSGGEENEADAGCVEAGSCAGSLAEKGISRCEGRSLNRSASQAKSYFNGKKILF